MTSNATATPDSVSVGDAAPTVLVLGASGYVGGRLVPDLLRSGHRVRCMTRSVGSLRSTRWAPRTEIVEGDLFDPESLVDAFEGVDVVVYLVHSLDEDGDFEAAELRAARHAREAAAASGVRRIVYLGGLGADDEELSPHLASRHAVGRELAAGTVEVVELRAAVILGAGSASFEMLRSLTEVLPVMAAPRWITKTKVQPIAIADVLTYLVAAIDLESSSPPDAGRRHVVVEVGGPDAMTYRELIDAYSDVAELRRRRIVSVPIIPLAVSSHWVNLVTPLPMQLSRRLISSLGHDVVVTDESATRLSPHRPMSTRMAIELAIAAVEDLDVPTRWSGSSPRNRAAQPRPWDPEWAGGTVYEDRRSVHTSASPDRVMRTVRGIGGRRGWYGFGPLWWLRGVLDQLVGGVGLRRGRRHPDEISVGEALDFWRVDDVDDDLFRLRAEMRLPGTAWLEWSVSLDPDADASTVVVQRARFVPTGLGGRLYWWVLVPFHAVIFPVMLRRLVGAAERSGPEHDMPAATSSPSDLCDAS